MLIKDVEEVQNVNDFKKKALDYWNGIESTVDGEFIGSMTRGIKGSPDPSHFIFGSNVGKGRIRHITTLNLNLQSILSRSRNVLFNFRVVVCRIRLFPTLILLSRIRMISNSRICLRK